MLVKQISRWRNVRVLVVRCSCLLVLVLLAASCPRYWGWRRVDQPTPLKPKADVRIWSGGEVQLWHGVVISDDSVSGIPHGKSLKCDSCRRSVPRTQVDSMKLGYHTVAEYVVVLSIFAFALWADAQNAH
jgi:hypothetical protein